VGLVLQKCTKKAWGGASWRKDVGRSKGGGGGGGGGGYDEGGCMGSLWRGWGVGQVSSPSP